MLKRPWIIAALGLVAVVSLLIYATSQPPGGVETKGSGAAMAWVSLGTAVASLLTSVVGLVLKLLDLRSAATAKDLKKQ